MPPIDLPMEACRLGHGARSVFAVSGREVIPLLAENRSVVFLFSTERVRRSFVAKRSIRSAEVGNGPDLRFGDVSIVLEVFRQQAG